MLSGSKKKGRAIEYNRVDDHDAAVFRDKSEEVPITESKRAWATAAPEIRESTNRHTVA